MILLVGLCALGCKKPKNKIYTFASDDFDSIEIGGLKSQPGSSSLEGTSDWFKEGTPVTITYATPCGPKTVTYPFAVEASQKNNDELRMHPPIEQRWQPLTATLLLDPTLAGDIKFAHRTFSVKANIGTPRDIDGYSHDPYSSKMVLNDPACAGAKVEINGKAVAVPPLPWPATELNDKDVKLALFAAQPDACYELRQYNYGATAAGCSCLRDRGFQQMEEIELVDEDVRFSLPAELTISIQ